MNKREYKEGLRLALHLVGFLGIFLTLWSFLLSDWTGGLACALTAFVAGLVLWLQRPDEEDEEETDCHDQSVDWPRNDRRGRRAG